MRIIHLALFTVLVFAPGAAAQDWRVQPNYGTVNLRSGFTPDPYVLNLRAGGFVDVGANIQGCLGYITRAPDFRFNYYAAGYPLTVATESAADTTLVISGPNTQWYCNDDSGGGQNARLTFTNPPSGQYDVWVGLKGQPNEEAPARLSISEMPPPN